MISETTLAFGGVSHARLCRHLLPFLTLYGLGLWIADYHGHVGQGFFRLALEFAEWLDPAYVEGVDEILSGVQN